MVLRALVFVLAFFWSGTALATFTQNSAGDLVITNGGLESAITSEWTCDSCGTFTRDTAQKKLGSYSLKISTSTGGIVQQQVTVTANTAYKISAWFYDTSGSLGATLRVRTGSYGAGTNVCSAADTASNNGVWSRVDCDIPDTNTTTTLYIQIVPNGFYTLYTDEIIPGNILLNLPAGSTGRKVSLYDMTGTEVQTVTAGDTSATITSFSDPTLYWRITDTDGKTFLDNSAWATIRGGAVWTWANASLAKDATWGMVLAGDNNADGDCTDVGEPGCYMKLQRNGTDYLALGPALGDNLALNKTVSASSSAGAGDCSGGYVDGSPCYAVDNDFGSRWYTTSTSNQWFCVDLGASTTINRVHYITRATIAGTDANGGNSMKIQASDDGCNTNMVDVTGGSVSRSLSKQEYIAFTFPAVTKRYVRIFFTSVHDRPEIFEVQMYNEGGSNVSSDMDYLILKKPDGTGFKSFHGLRYDAYTNNADGSVTFSKSITGYGGTLTLSANYKLVDDVWRKRISVSSSVDALMSMRNVLHQSDASIPCSSTYAGGSVACSGAASDNRAKPFQMTALNLPYAFGLTPDNGCNAKWYINRLDAGGEDYSRDITGVKADDNWSQAFVTYGKRNTQGDSYYKLTAGQAYTFDVMYSRSLDPRPYATEQAGSIALATGKGKSGLTLLDKVFWGTSYQLVQNPNISNTQDICMYYPSWFYANGGMYPGDSIWGLIGLGDAASTREVLYAWRKAANISTDAFIVPPSDTFSTTPPTLIGGGRSSEFMGLLLGYAVKKGFVTVQSSCPDYRTCVTTAERDALAASIESHIPTDGWMLGDLGGSLADSLNLDLRNSNNATDYAAFPYAVYWLPGYEGVRAAGATIDQSKLNTLESNLRSLYSTTDGYVHAGRYGNWQVISSGAYSGGSMVEGQGDYITPTTARFVVPAGHANAAISFYSKKQSNAGYMQVQKNGVDVAGSPFDLYGVAHPWDGNNIEGLSTGGIYYPYIKSTANPRIRKDGMNFPGTYNVLQLRVKSYSNGPTGVKVYYEDAVDCAVGSGSETCTQVFNGVITADGTWQTINLTMTDAEWGAGDTIQGYLRFEWLGMTITGTVEVDWIKRYDGATYVTIDDFATDAGNTVTAFPLTETVSTGDEIILRVTQSKNASSTGYKISLDKIVIGGTTYEETDTGFQCGSLGGDCLNGYTRGWKRWKDGKILTGEFLMRSLFGNPVLTDEQVTSHIEHMPTGNMGNGTLLSYVQSQDDKCLDAYFVSGKYCGGFENGETNFLFNAASLQLATTQLGDLPLWYKHDEKAQQFVLVGSGWSNETDANAYYRKYVWKSSAAGDYVEFSGVPYTGVEVYAIVGGGQGTAKIYFDSGSGYDAGTTVNLSSASNPVYSQTGLTYSPNYKIKIEVVSGAVRLDYVRTKTKPSWLLQARIDEEFYMGPSGKEHLVTDYYHAKYRTVDNGSNYYGFHILYKGDALSSIRRRYFFEDYHFRR